MPASWPNARVILEYWLLLWYQPPMTASHIGFYTQHKISPVRQDISDLARHFERRESLYRLLGILPQALKGRSVAEVGPGSGFNSLYTASLGPARYVLVEGNPTGVEDINRLFAGFPALAPLIDIAPVLIEDYQVTEPFDFVFCEGLLSGVPNPRQVLAKLAEMTAPGGVLVFTCVDHVAHFAETLRRLMAWRLIRPGQPLESQVATLLPAFTPHLARLKGMSRRHDDWIIDNLIHPGSIIHNINLPEGLELLGDAFDIYGASPHFVTDWRWYKQLVGDDRRYNEPAIAQYWSNIHNLLDHRVVLPPASEEFGKLLYQRCSQVRDQVRQYEASYDQAVLASILALLDDIVAQVRTVSAPVAETLADARRILAAPADAQAIADAPAFGDLFGRGQHYFSVIRRATPALPSQAS